MEYIIELKTNKGESRFEKATANTAKRACEKAIVQAEDAGLTESMGTFEVVKVFAEAPDWETIEAKALTWAIDDVFADTGDMTDQQVIEQLDQGKLPEELVPTEEHEMNDAPQLLIAIHSRRSAVLIFAESILNHNQKEKQ